MFTVSSACVESVEDRLLHFFDARLAEMSPEDQERTVNAALAVEVPDVTPET
jgi:hypothetical protein